MERMPFDKTKSKVAVVGVGYWGKNLVRNFYGLGALGALCDAQRAIEQKCNAEYESVKFYRELGEVLRDPEIHSVALATPAISHYEWPIVALQVLQYVFVD